jgi:hypothetical protein
MVAINGDSSKSLGSLVLSGMGFATVNRELCQNPFRSGHLKVESEMPPGKEQEEQDAKLFSLPAD